MMTPRPSLYKRLKVYLFILTLLFLFFAPTTKNKPSLQAFVTSADACPFKCVRCTSWDPDAWPRTCLTYECDAECEAGDPGGGGGGNQPPSISHTLTCTQNGLNSWCIGALSIDLSASDPQNAAVVISGDVNGTNFTCTTNPCTLNLPEGSGLVTYKVDSATGLSASGSAFYYLDVTTPQVSGSVNGSLGTTGWYISQTTVAASASDVLSGIASFEMNVDNTGWRTYSDITFTDSMHTIQYRAYDNAGNITETAIQPINLDTVTPILNVSVSGVTGNSNWYISNVTLTPTASDPSTGSGQASGLASLEVSINGTSFTNYQSPITLTDGIHTIQFRATDNAGNITQTVSQEIKVDTVTPGLSLATNGTTGLNGWYVSNATITSKVSDVTSGVALIEATTDGGPWMVITNHQLPLFTDGIHTYQVRVTDQAGNEMATPVLSVNVDTTAPSLNAASQIGLLDDLSYTLQDDSSGLDQFSLLISDKDNSQPATGSVWALSGNISSGAYRWSGRYANDAIANVGLHPFALVLTDKAGNETRLNGIIEVTRRDLLYLELIVPPANPAPSNAIATIPSLTANSSTSTTSQSTESTPAASFGGTTNETPVEQTTTSLSGQEVVFRGLSAETGFGSGNQSTNTPITNPNILWGAAAAALLGATTAEWQRQREEARRNAQSNGSSSDNDEIPADVLARRRARVIAKNETKREQERRWEAARVQQQAQQKAKIAKILQADITEDEKLAAYKQTPEYIARQESIKEYEHQKAIESHRAGERQQSTEWTPACSIDNPYGLPPATQPALDWLGNLYFNKHLPGTTALERTLYILNATQSGNFLHFDMKRIPSGDSGFATQYQDSSIWERSSHQVGHYLTAVDISIQANSQPTPLKPLARFLGQSVILGHEMLGDDITIHQLPWIGHTVQTYLGIRAQILSLGKVDDWMCSQNDEDLDKILTYGPADDVNYFHYGNSKEDLRLSCEGWVMGEKLANGEFDSPQQLGNYIKDRLK